MQDRFDLPPKQISEEVVHLGCKVASDIFSHRAGRLTKEVARLVTYTGDDTSFEDFAKQENIRPGEAMRITMSVTPYGRYNFKEALRDGKRKLKGLWEAAVYWLDAEGTHNSFQTRPVKIKLKGKRPRVKE